MLNDGSSTFHSATYHTNSVIDLTIVHDSAALQMNWQVNDDPWGSDPFPIILRYRAKPDLRMKTKKAPCLHSKKTDWDLFQSNLDKNIKLLNGIEFMETEVLYATFISIIEKSIADSTPSSSNSDLSYLLINDLSDLHMPLLHPVFGGMKNATNLFV